MTYDPDHPDHLELSAAPLSGEELRALIRSHDRVAAGEQHPIGVRVFSSALAIALRDVEIARHNALVAMQASGSLPPSWEAAVAALDPDDDADTHGDATEDSEEPPGGGVGS